MDKSMTADEIRALRKRLDLTQAELAGRIGLTREAVTQWETGRARPNGPARILLRQLEAVADSRRKISPSEEKLHV